MNSSAATPPPASGSRRLQPAGLAAAITLGAAAMRVAHRDA